MLRLPTPKHEILYPPKHRTKSPPMLGPLAYAVFESMGTGLFGYLDAQYIR